MKLLITLLLTGLFSITPAWAGSPPKNTPELLNKGKTAFMTSCVTCHGVKGDGMGDAGKYMSPKPRNFATGKFKNGDTVSNIFKSITKGLDGTSMVGFPGISEDDRWALAYYVLSFKNKK